MRRRAGASAAAVLTVLTAGALAATPAAPAAAHAGGLSPTNVRSTVTSVVPAVPGLSIATVEGGARLRLANGTGVPVTVGEGGGGGAPDEVGSGEVRTWVDVRATSLDRPFSAPGPGQGQWWRVDLDVGDREVTVRGRLEWQEPPRRAWAWWVATAVLAVAVPAAGAATRRRGAVVAVATVTTVLAAAAHVAGSALAVTTGPLALVVLGAAGVGLFAWPLGLVGALGAARGRPYGILAAFVAATLTVVLALPDVTAFHHALVPFGAGTRGDADLDRALVAVSVGGGAGAAAAAVAALRAVPDAG